MSAFNKSVMKLKNNKMPGNNILDQYRFWGFFKILLMLKRMAVALDPDLQQHQHHPKPL